MSRNWTADEVRALGARTDLVTAASVLGIGRTSAYELARRGEFPVKTLRLGHKYVVVVASLLRLLELDQDPHPEPAEPIGPMRTAS